MNKPDTAHLGRRTPRESVSVEVAQIVIEYLLSGRVKKGDRLPSERDLAAALNVGRSAVREALSALILLGVLEVRPGGGYYLRGIASELLPRVISWGLLLGEKQPIDLFEARASIEVRAAYLAAKNANPAMIVELRAAFKAISKRPKDTESMVEDDLAFHETLVRSTDNKILFDLWSSIRSLLKVWIVRVNEREHHSREFVRVHRAVMDAVEARDPDAAARAMNALMDVSTKTITDLLADDAAMAEAAE